MAQEAWPELPYDAWKDTADTLHMWLQVVGKVKLELSPFLNEWWEVGFHLTARGLTSGLIPYQSQSFDVVVDIFDHSLEIRLSSGHNRRLPLHAQSVADFYRHFMAALAELGVDVHINPTPVEIPHPIPFEQDTRHASYDSEWVQRWWRVMLGVQRAIERYRTPFHGKSSPVLFYWGTFDLNETRFNGRRLTPKPGTDRILRYAEDEENFAVGFWPGDERYPHAACYAYMYPEPQGAHSTQVQPASASFNQTLGEFVLPYHDLRQASSPHDAIVEFFQSTYETTAKLAGWDRQALEGHVPAGTGTG